MDPLSAATLGLSIGKTVIELVIDLVRDSGKDVKDLRNAKVEVSVSFGGGEGEAVKAQREISSLWTKEDEESAGF